LPWGEAFYRVEFDAKDLATRPQVWLACSALARSSNPTVIWLNNEKLAAVPTPESEPVAVSMAGKLKPGRNEVIIRVPRESAEQAGADQVYGGKMFGPVFLTAAEPKRYPYLGALANARFVDMRMWQIEGVTATHRTMLDLALALDPDHPFNLSGDASIGNDQFTALAEEYGATCQHTGREAWYHTWWPGLGLVGGFYGTSEESGTPSTHGFAGAMTRELGWMMIDGDSNHNLFHNIEDYQIEEQKTHWFTQHQRALQCFGKYLRVMPQIAILRSGRNMTLGSQEPWRWDLGTGTLQRSHFDNAYATETELLKGMTDACPVLLDDGTEIMDDDVIAALQRYIEKGGTFIALHQTGRHTSILQDAQPLARLTGMITSPHASARLHIVNGAPVLGGGGVAGREFTGSGVGLKPAPSGVAIPGEEPVTVASWDDGTTAIAVRRLGKGRIIQLGTTCWQAHFEIMEQLLGDVGVQRNADASDPTVWARKATSKNGLQDWLLTFNDSDTPRTADVRLAVDKKPEAVWDLLTRTPVESTFANGFVTVPQVHFTAHETRLFAVKRADLVDGLEFWWGEKTRFWRRPPATTSPAVAAAKKWLTTVKPEASTDAIPFQTWRFLADRDGSVAGAAGKDAWQQPGFADTGWKQLENGPWNLLDPSLADWHGVGLYRSTFNVPPAWKDRRVILTLFDWDRPIVYDQAEFFLNGTKVAEYKARGWSHAAVYDVTALLRADGNVLAVKVQGGKEFCGICGSVWLAPELRFPQELDLAGAWQAVQSGYHTTVPAQLPGKPTGRYLMRDFDLPAAWNGKTVYTHVEIDNQWLGCIVVNGKLIANNAYLHPFAPRCEVNLTPFLVAGQNHIELWPYSTMPSVFVHDLHAQMPMPVSVIRLGLVAPDPKR
ncbi:MAG: sugar-binding domain-containing protein, partial [Phycisphaerae bacterium]